MNCQVTPFPNKISIHDSTVSLNDGSLTLSRRTPLSYRNESIDCFANQWTGFYMITASVLKELNTII